MRWDQVVSGDVKFSAGNLILNHLVSQIACAGVRVDAVKLVAPQKGHGVREYMRVGGRVHGRKKAENEAFSCGYWQV